MIKDCENKRGELRKMQYYGALDLENMADDCCYRAEGSDNIIFVKKPDWSNIRQLRFAGQIFKTEGDEQKQQEKIKLLEEYLSAMLSVLSVDIRHHFGGGIKDPLPHVCMTLLVPCETGEAFRKKIREFLISQNVGQVQFLAKEAAAVLYVLKEEDPVQTEKSLFLCVDAGETRCSSSLFYIKEGKIGILERNTQEGAGAGALDQAFLKHLKKLLGNGFVGFHAKGEEFQRLLLNWINGRIRMAGDVQLRMDDFWRYAQKQLSKEEQSCIRRQLSGVYSKKLTLSEKTIRDFASEAFHAVWEQIQRMLKKAQQDQYLAGQLRILVNGSYLNMPLLQKFLTERLDAADEMGEREHVVLCRSACLRGAISKFEQKDRLFGVAAPKTLGILAKREGGAVDFVKLIPGGRKLPWGYEGMAFITLSRPENGEAEVDFYSLPSYWQEGEGVENIALEASVSVTSPKTKFQNRKLKASVKMGSMPEAEVYDLTSGNRGAVRLTGIWTQVGDIIADCSPLQKR